MLQQATGCGIDTKRLQETRGASCVDYMLQSVTYVEKSDLARATSAMDSPQSWASPDRIVDCTHSVLA